MAPNGDIWLAYVEFRHHPDHDKLRAPYKDPPKDLSVLVAPAKGDQILVKRFTGNRWEEPIAITPAGGDLYRPAIAVDGSGRPWVFWSANQKNNFDLWARVIENGTPGKTVQISAAPGSDVFPAAATDAGGRVWVTWQGWRDGKGVIFAATQEGTVSPPRRRYRIPRPTSGIRPSPRILGTSHSSLGFLPQWQLRYLCAHGHRAGAMGRRNPGGRDTALRSLSFDRLRFPGAVVDRLRGRARQWGKDFGAHRSTGVPIYEARGVRLVGLDRSGKLIRPAADPDGALQGLADIREDGGGRQGDIKGWERSDPETFTQRASNAHPWPANNPRNSLPRLTVDASGRIWLAFRSMHPAVWTPIGTSWSEYVISYDGKGWTGPTYIFRSDNVLDNRPALVSQRGGELVVIGSSDSRREIQYMLKKGWDLKQLLGSAIPDPYNNDLYARHRRCPRWRTDDGTSRCSGLLLAREPKALEPPAPPKAPDRPPPLPRWISTSRIRNRLDRISTMFITRRNPRGNIGQHDQIRQRHDEFLSRYQAQLPQAARQKVIINNRATVESRFYPRGSAARTMARKSSAFRLAPPIRPPSTSG